ncbi:methyladenine glycosylase family protein [Mycobacterium kansasii 824]|nr:methyladenine glycosylase family protein [Mycobacterium kansasii 824]
MSDDGLVRCGWAVVRAGPDAELYRNYHDQEWGRPLRGGVALFERMSLEAFQSGLSWLTILRKRENFRCAFSGFDIETVAHYTDADVQRLLADAGLCATGPRSRRRSRTRGLLPSSGQRRTCRTCCGRSRRRPGGGRQPYPKSLQPLRNPRRWRAN